MPAQREKAVVAVGDDTVATLGQRLSAAIRDRVASASNGAATATANGNGNGANGAIATPSTREIAIDVCAAILRETGAGTAEHSSDVVLITEVIAERMGIAGEEAKDLLAAARLHDVGKAWVPSRILEKPGPLSDDEWEVMRQHTVVGQEILSSVDELDGVGRIVRHSHERWDGTGYPDRLEGSEIPLGSRIVFCADAFHAIRCDRPYRKGRPAREAVAEIKRCAGTQFDPEVAAALEDVVGDRRRLPRGARGTRLVALFMCLAVGGAGTALARSGALGQATAPASATASKPPPACGPAGCPSVAVPVGVPASVGLPVGAFIGPRVPDPRFRGTLHGAVGGAKPGATKTKGHRAMGRERSADHASKGKSTARGHTAHSHESGQSESSARISAASSHGGGGGSGGSHGSSGSHRSSSHRSSGSHGNGRASRHSSGSHGNSGGSHGNSAGSHGNSH